MEKKYAIRFGPTAQRQYDSLPSQAQKQLDTGLKKLQQDPFHGKGRTGPDITHSITFGGFGFAEYCVHESYVVISVIQITWAG